MTTERPITLQEYAMRFGTYMGLFWIFKFIFLPIGFSIPLLQLLFILMTLFVPVLATFMHAATATSIMKVIFLSLRRSVSAF